MRCSERLAPSAPRFPLNLTFNPQPRATPPAVAHLVFVRRLMTSREIKQGIRAFLREKAGDEIDLAWFERAGETAKETLFHILRLPSTSRKTRLTIKSLLVAAFPSRDVESRLIAYVREQPDSRVRNIDERVLHDMIERRDDLRRTLT